MEINCKEINIEVGPPRTIIKEEFNCMDVISEKEISFGDFIKKEKIECDEMIIKEEADHDIANKIEDSHHIFIKEPANTEFIKKTEAYLNNIKIEQDGYNNRENIKTIDLCNFKIKQETNNFNVKDDYIDFDIIKGDIPSESIKKEELNFSEYEYLDSVQKYENFMEDALKTGQARSKSNFFDEIDKLVETQTVRPQYAVSMDLPTAALTNSAEEPGVTLKDRVKQRYIIVNKSLNKTRPSTRMKSVQIAIRELVSETRRQSDINREQLRISREKLALEKEKFNKLKLREKMSSDKKNAPVVDNYLDVTEENNSIIKKNNLLRERNNFLIANLFTKIVNFENFLKSLDY